MVRTQITPPLAGGSSLPDSTPFAADVYWSADRIAILQPCGELDLATVPAFAARIDELLSDPPDGLVVDLAGLRFLAVRGIGEFDRLHRRAAADQRLRIRLARPPVNVARVLRLSRLDLVFDTYDTVQAAIDSLAVPADRGIRAEEISS